MPLFEPVVLEGRGYALRHIGPSPSIYPPAPGSALTTSPPVALTSYVVLQQPQMVARDLPMSNAPNSPDFVSGEWTGRLIDSGDFTLIFPNKEASDGTPWRNRFASNGKNQWIEVKNDGYLEFCGCIEKVDLKRDQITITGHDAFFQLKTAYERDWICVLAPRDVMERSSQVWSGTTLDNFAYSGLTTVPAAQWIAAHTGTGSTPLISMAGGCSFSCTAGTGTSTLTNTSAALGTATNTWRAVVTVTALTINSILTSGFGFEITESSGDAYELVLAAGSAYFLANVGSYSITGDYQAVVSASSYVLMLESDGEWVWAYVNGQFVSGCRRNTTASTTLATKLLLNTTSGSASTCTATVGSIIVETLQPFLMRSADKGDYALPSTTGYASGTISTYPPGGLHGRYYNDADLLSDTNRLIRIHHEARSVAYVGSTGGPGEYANQQDPTINGQANPLPGAATSNWSCVWFGAIYLKLSATGTYTFTIILPTVANNFGVRLWVGKTSWGTQLLNGGTTDEWVNNGSGGFSNTSGATYTYTLTSGSSSPLIGYYSYNGMGNQGMATVARDGWYPIRLEYAVDATASVAPVFKFTPPTSYTDAGGGTITGSTSQVVPSTSLSPLGMVDERSQGVSHFDLLQTTAQAFGYQCSVEPQQLESNAFPGVLAPRFREGYDYDALLEPDDNARAEGLINYGNTLDATDCAASIFGNGAGFQNGNSGQLQGYVFDPAHVKAALFNLQAWNDFSDASFESLLLALLNSRLGLQLDPWQLITGDPIGRPRLANTWPLPSSLAQMRWRPGDGMRVYALDVNVQDTSPRQLLTVTRQLHPNGATGTQVNFAARPRSPTYVLKQAMFQATRWQRNYQGAPVPTPGNYCQNVPIINGQVGSAASVVSLEPGQSVISAFLKVNLNASNLSFNVLVNGTDVTATLKGPWTAAPVTINLGAVATPNSSGEVSVQLKNNGGSIGIFSWQLLLTIAG